MVATTDAERRCTSPAGLQESIDALVAAKQVHYSFDASMFVPKSFFVLFILLPYEESRFVIVCHVQPVSRRSGAVSCVPLEPKTLCAFTPKLVWSSCLSFYPSLCMFFPVSIVSVCADTQAEADALAQQVCAAVTRLAGWRLTVSPSTCTSAAARFLSLRARYWIHDTECTILNARYWMHDSESMVTDTLYTHIQLNRPNCMLCKENENYQFEL